MKKVLSVFLAIIILLSASSASLEALAAGKPTNGWYETGGNKYYLVDGAYVKGFTVIGQGFYYFNEKTGALVTNSWATVSVKQDGLTEKYKVYATASGKLKEGWLKYNNKYYYLNPFMITSDTCLINGKFYVFEANGARTTKKGWIALDRNAGAGTTQRRWTYVTGGGQAVTGWQKIGTKRYYFNPKNALMTEDGVRKVGKKICYFNSDGSWANTKTGWIKYNGEKYYFVNGIAAMGWKKINGYAYFFDRTSGKMLYGGPYYILQKDGSPGAVYFLDRNGTLTSKTGFRIYTDYDSELNTDVTRYAYVLNSKGHCKTGWRKINGKSYFFSYDNGEMYMNGGRSVTANGKTIAYFFEPKGALTTKTGWQTVTKTKSDGTKITKKYYVTAGGRCATGWKKIGNIRYYFNADGEMLCGNIFVINGKICYFNISGTYDYTKEGVVKKNGQYYYFVKGLGQTGWQTVNGINRYFDATMGYMYRNGVYEIGGVMYEFDSAGRATKV